MAFGRGTSCAEDSSWTRRYSGEEFGHVITGRIVEDQRDRRIAPRISVEMEARLRELGTTGTEARILNLSETGFMAETAGEFEVGARVWLMVPVRERANANLEGQRGTWVVWRKWVKITSSAQIQTKAHVHQRSRK